MATEVLEAVVSVACSWSYIRPYRRKAIRRPKRVVNGLGYHDSGVLVFAKEIPIYRKLLTWAGRPGGLGSGPEEEPGRPLARIHARGIDCPRQDQPRHLG